MTVKCGGTGAKPKQNKSRVETKWENPNIYK